MSVLVSCENAVELNTIKLLVMEHIVNIDNSVNVEFNGDFMIFLIKVSELIFCLYIFFG